MAIEMRQVTDADELEQVYRFLYRVYVEQMGRVQKYADRARRRIEEPLDATARIFAAFDDDGQVVGTVRYNFAGDADAFYRAFYGMERLTPYYPDRVTFTTKLMVDPHYSGTRLGTELAIAIFHAGSVEGSCFNLIDCNPPMRRYFDRLGYRPFLPDGSHPEYGRVHRMVLVHNDIAHLEAVRSPFLLVMSDLPIDRDSVSYYHDHHAWDGNGAAEHLPHDEPLTIKEWDR